MSSTTSIDPTGAIPASWLATPINDYITWLRDRGHTDSGIRKRIPTLIEFADYARKRGVGVSDLPSLVERFVDDRVRGRQRASSAADRKGRHAYEIRHPIEQMLWVVLPDLRRRNQTVEPTFHGQAAGFFDALRCERGLCEGTIRLYRYHLVRFERFLADAGVDDLNGIGAGHIDGFVAAMAAILCRASLPALCSALRHLFRWLHRERRITRDLTGCVGAPLAYRLSTIPRSIPWADIERMLSVVDRETALGMRDYAMLLLMVVYGLRAREVAALTLDNIDWRGERLRVPGRKAGHSTAYPLSAVVGDALLAYLRHGRPQTVERKVFIRAVAPLRPVGHHIVADRAAVYLHAAGVVVHRAGSHTLRHSCAQRLVDADFSLKVIGDYLGHRVPTSTEIYTKVAVETLRLVALGNGEVVL